MIYLPTNNHLPAAIQLATDAARSVITLLAIVYVWGYVQSIVYIQYVDREARIKLHYNYNVLRCSAVRWYGAASGNIHSGIHYI
jgi:ribosomal protein S8